MLEAIVAILAGLVLLTGLMSVIPALGKYLDQFGQFLSGFQGIIGIIALILGILDILNGFALLNLMLIISGLVLMVGILPLIPGVGNALEKFAMWLGSGQAIIGVITLIVGILALL
ncbi:MAG: hypothetical protein PHW93_06305 [Candidatus Methanomethylophilaceae archaeon]|nr:hypothetical protein [Candidatus Methanomethylophilaceae archaeon]